jgi:hypothetical protein
MPGGEAAERLHEDLARARRVVAEESSEVHLEPDSASEGRFLSKVTRVAAVNRLALIPAGGTGRAGVSGRDAEGEGHAIEIGPDQAAANRGAQQLEQEQEMPPEKMESGAETRRELSHLRSWIIKSAGEPLLDDHFHLESDGTHLPSTCYSKWRLIARLLGLPLGALSVTLVFSDFPLPTFAAVPASRSRSARSRSDQSRRPARPPADGGRRRARSVAPGPSEVTGRASRGELGPRGTIKSGRGPDGPTILAALELDLATIRAGLGGRSGRRVIAARILDRPAPRARIT